MNNQSKLFTLNTRDAIRALVMAVLTPVVEILQKAVEKGEWVFSWDLIWHAALTGALTYLIKNFFTQADPIKEVTKTDDGTVTKTVVQTDSVDVVVK